MPNMIETIIEIDRNARAQVEKAKENANASIASAKAEVDSRRKTTREEAELQLDRARESYEGFADEEVQASAEKRERQIASLEKAMNDNSRRWSDEIIGRIIG